MVFVGRRYAPLSVRLVEQALKVPGGGWGPVEDVLKLLPGGHYDVPFGALDDDAGTTHVGPTASGAQRVLPCCPLWRVNFVTSRCLAVMIQRVVLPNLSQRRIPVQREDPPCNAGRSEVKVVRACVRACVGG